LKSKDHKKLIIDFKGQVLYQAFKKVIDFCYLEDINLLNSICDSTEMIETIKLSNQYNLSMMVKATESYFQDHMMNLLESNSTCLSIKNQPQSNGNTKKRTSPTSEAQNKEGGRGQQSRGAP